MRSPEREESRFMVVFVNCIGSTSGITVIKSLKDIKDKTIKIIGADSDTFIASVNWVDKFYKVPRVKENGYLETILSICRTENVDMYISVLDPEFRLISESKSMFRDVGTHAVISDPETIGICYDKMKTMEVLRGLGLHTPQTYTTEEFRKSEQFPFIVKPRLGGSGSNGVFMIDDRIDKEYFIAKNEQRLDEFVYQEKVNGKEYTVDCLFDFHGKPLYIIPRRRIETRAGISYKGVIVRDETVMEEVRHLSAQVKFIGPICIQFLKDEHGTNKYIEINARFGAATTFTLKGAGINFVEALLQLQESKKLELKEPAWGAKVMHYWEEVVVSW
jgi:carbamoyl-phosphate synthase large subunit